MKIWSKNFLDKQYTYYLIKNGIVNLAHTGDFASKELSHSGWSGGGTQGESVTGYYLMSAYWVSSRLVYTLKRINFSKYKMLNIDFSYTKYSTQYWPDAFLTVNDGKKNIYTLASGSDVSRKTISLELEDYPDLINCALEFKISNSTRSDQVGYYGLHIYNMWLS